MRILTLENTSFELNKLPDNIEDDIRFAVLDNSNADDPDFFFNPLIFLESFNSPAIVLEINGYELTMPLDWCLAVGCSQSGSDLEVLPLTSLNDRGFEAFLFNPLTGTHPKFGKIETISIEDSKLTKGWAVFNDDMLLSNFPLNTKNRPTLSTGGEKACYYQNYY